MKLLEFINLKLSSCCYTTDHINSQFTTLKTTNISERKKKLCNILFDIILGIIFCIIFNICTSTGNINILILALRSKVKNDLESLLKWLMGVPAGLKLNHEL